MKRIKEIIIGLLALAIIGVVFYLFKVQKQNDEFKQEITAEKDALSKDLEDKLSELVEVNNLKDSITKTYNLTTEELTSVNNQLESSQSEITSLQKEIKSTKNWSYRQIRNLKDQLKEITLNKEQLFAQIDSLRTANDSLKVEIAVTKSELNDERNYSTELATKLLDATKIQITDVNVIAVKESSKGEYKVTSRARKADAFKVEYNVLNNKALTDSKCDIFYVLKGIDGKIINPSGEFTYRGDPKEFTSGDRLTLSGDTMPVSHIIPINDVKLVKGVYTLEFYSTDGLLAERVITLKSGIF